MTVIEQLDALVLDLLDSASAIGPTACLVVLFVVLSLEASLFVGLFVSGEIALLVSVGALGERWAVPMLLVAVLANTVGQAGGYGIGRGVGPSLQRSWAGRKISASSWDTAHEVLRGRGARALLTTRFIAFVHAVVPAVAGMLRVPFARFMVMAVAGATAWATVHTSLALALGQAARAIGYSWTAVVVTVVAAAVSGTVLYRSVRRVDREKSAEQPEPARP
ncbi:hypothetical protein GIY23_19725 [Allosaccharopolyspora coralli]|uniref:VTT domain-containing protein n=1 Tax=Allosaccharopolyspora coralli TaxID=2665642 RepID=A0A5Q3Q9T8_9PSEU|nr:VTT domain-containing protein [Allosaccharopolyspora coralli]QGK71441.1 hypothetical protein GIY23_19725 [Allosaccharopolyspora coralli]